MKAFNKILISAAAVTGMLTLGSCVGDLDLQPVDPNSATANMYEDNPEEFMDGVMADVYMQYATQGANGNASVSGFDGGMSTFERSIFILEEINTDEASWLPVADVDYGTFQYGVVPSNNRAILGTYSRFMINVTLCNDFIQTFSDDSETFKLPAELKAKRDEYVRECKILRSAAYFYLIDCFGNVPYADETTLTGSVPAQMKRAEIFPLVVQTLKDVIAEYDACNDSYAKEQVYGYVNKEVAQALLVKFYLNAEVYTGTPMWAECAEMAEKIIQAHQGTGYKGSGLCEYYLPLFGANNDQYALGHAGSPVNEIIWTIPQNATYLTSWANGTFLLDAMLGEVDGYDCSKAKYNANDAWKCIVAREQFSRKFDWGQDMQSPTDKRVALWCADAEGFAITNGVLDQDHWGDNGYLPIKFSNFDYDAATGEPYPVRPAKEEDVVEGQHYSPAATTQIGTDYPMIRLAEIYLSAAEALVKGGLDTKKALDYVNLIKGRAGLKPLEVLNNSNISELEDERCRELYTEGTRRTDLIRYGKWISGYTWNWKNQVPTGADYPATFLLYPLPSSTVFLAGYQQNPGY